MSHAFLSAFGTAFRRCLLYLSLSSLDYHDFGYAIHSFPSYARTRRPSQSQRLGGHYIDFTGRTLRSCFRVSVHYTWSSASGTRRVSRRLSVLVCCGVPGRLEGGVGPGGFAGPIHRWVCFACWTLRGQRSGRHLYCMFPRALNVPFFRHWSQLYLPCNNDVVRVYIAKRHPHSP